MTCIRTWRHRLVAAALLAAIAAPAGAAATAASLFIDQTQGFSLTGTPPSIRRDEGGPPPENVIFAEHQALQFQGAPAGFWVADQWWGLSAVTVKADTTLHQSYELGVYEANYLGDFKVFGHASNRLQIWAAGLSETANFEWDDGYFGYNGYLDFIPPRRLKPYTLDYSFAFPYTAAGLQSFVDVPSVGIYVSKLTGMWIAHYLEDDNYTTFANPISQFQGNVTLRYQFDPMSAPIPEPPMAVLSLLGLFFLRATPRRWHPPHSRGGAAQ